jgi:hypothetical protein
VDASTLRRQLLELLKGGSAHITFQQVLADFPMDHINSRVSGIPYSPWELIEHMRITQFDILDFIRNPDYAERKWPEEYWPPKGKKATEREWKQTIDRFRDDLDALRAIVKDSRTDLTAPLPHAPKYDTLREILLAADHSAYHLGQVVALRRALKICRSAP